ncbi:MAG: ADP-ribosylation/crystallin J1 [Chitinophagaceae bacterium]|jgi:hypothetical protein|nr:ADP-ribosylation/crystallin J1 [Chitinophagaceae bacterium]
MEKLQLTTLYYLIDQKELNQIVESNYKKIPPRANDQNMFYPLLNQAYAEQIAHDWNNNGFYATYAVHVIAVDMLTAYLEQFPVQQVGNEMEKELWILSTELEKFNAQIMGRIKLVKSFFGERSIKIAV